MGAISLAYKRYVDVNPKYHRCFCRSSLSRSCFCGKALNSATSQFIELKVRLINCYDVKIRWLHSRASVHKTCCPHNNCNRCIAQCTCRGNINNLFGLNHHASETEDVNKKALFMEAERQSRMCLLIDWGQTDDGLMSLIGLEDRSSGLLAIFSVRASI